MIIKSLWIDNSIPICTRDIIRSDTTTNTLDLVFAIDKSNSGDQAGFAGAAIDLLNELTEVENLKVKVGVVFGDALARDAVQVTSNGKYSGLVDISKMPG